MSGLIPEESRELLWLAKSRLDQLDFYPEPVDLRDTDVRGCDLSSALFLTQPQINGAIGDPATTLPEDLSRPARWAS